VSSGAFEQQHLELCRTDAHLLCRLIGRRVIELSRSRGSQEFADDDAVRIEAALERLGANASDDVAPPAVSTADAE
jgi:hypothetical protein